MATRPVFLAGDLKSPVKEIPVDFKWYPGYSLSQKQKSIFSLHSAFILQHPLKKVIEVSTKSTEVLGVHLSAFNLSFKHEDKQITVEEAFQSSKVFQKGGPFPDFIGKDPAVIKKDPRLYQSGLLTGFLFDSKMWPLEPKTVFYDWLYINALLDNPSLAEKVTHYDAFTDIEFNPAKSFNCQARAAATFVALAHNGKEQLARDSANFIEYILSRSDISKQGSFWE